MKLRLAVKHIVYYVNSDDAWFAMTSYPVLPNAYHYILVAIFEDHKHVEIIGTKNAYKSFIVKDEDITARCTSLFTYVLYFN